MFIGVIGAAIAYKMHYFVERRFKIDDAVGAVAVHGYAGFAGLVVAGFMLWGHPATAGYHATVATITPWGQFAGAVVMFFVLGFVPAWIASTIMKSLGVLRVPESVELLGLDISAEIISEREAREVSAADAAEARRLGLLAG
jgi:ammonia channel protein AmtB